MSLIEGFLRCWYVSSSWKPKRGDLRNTSRCQFLKYSTVAIALSFTGHGEVEGDPFEKSTRGMVSWVTWERCKKSKVEKET